MTDPFLLVCAAMGVLFVGKLIENNSRSKTGCAMTIFMLAVLVLGAVALAPELVP